jgi:hypothetical protein
MRKLSWCVPYLVIFGCLIPISSCGVTDARPAPPAQGGGFKIETIDFLGNLPWSCGCALQLCRDRDTKTGLTVFLSSFNKVIARMNINGQDVELREIDRHRSRDEMGIDIIIVNYRVIRVVDNPCPGCREPGQRDREDPYSDRTLRRDSGDYSQRDRQNRRETSWGYSLQPDIYDSQEYNPRDDPRDDRDYYPRDDRDYNTYRNPRSPRIIYPGPEFRELWVRVEYFVNPACCRWEDGRRLDCVEARIKVFRRDTQTDEVRTTGTCGCI